MPRKVSARNTKKTSPLNTSSLYRKVSQNYFNLLLGVFIFLLILIGIFQVAKKAPPQTTTNKLTQLFNLNKETTTNQSEKSYSVKNGDSLWIIAEKFYGSGHNAHDIAVANKLPDADSIYPDQKLIIPSTPVRAPTKGSIESGASVSEASSYTIKMGDSLWIIAQRVYGDPFAWVKIAEANSIPNPDLIHPGTVLKIPR